MKVVITSEDELREVAGELLFLSYNLRHWTKEWEKEHGVETKVLKKKWEKRLDDYLNKLGMEKTKLKSEIKIVFNEPDMEKE